MIKYGCLMNMLAVQCYMKVYNLCLLNVNFLLKNHHKNLLRKSSNCCQQYVY